jgi:hypothetical protein
MGTWGTALYSDDVACDVRDTYRDLTKVGFRGEELILMLNEQCGASKEDEIVYSLVLADLLWKDGMLTPKIRERALSIIDGESDLARWANDSKARKQRSKALAALRAKLESPQRKAGGANSNRFIDICPWEIGEVIFYPYKDGLVVPLHVQGYFTRFGGRSPVCEVLDWNGSGFPSEGQILKMSTLQSDIPLKSIPRYENHELLAQLEKFKQVNGLPPDFTWREYEEWWLGTSRALVRISEGDRIFRSLNRPGIIKPLQKRFFQQLLVQNCWSLWKDAHLWLSDRFSRYPSRWSEANKRLFSTAGEVSLDPLDSGGRPTDEES